MQSVSSDEFVASPQTERQREFEARVKEMGAKHGAERTNLAYGYASR